MKRRSIALLSISTLILAVGLARAQSARNGWAKYDGNKIHYYDVGDPKAKNALLFVHGWTCSADFWKDSLNAFPSYRVIAVDLPGHGQSDKPKVDYTMAYFANSIEAVMKDAKLQKAVLVGHSMGTPVIRQFYRIYPDQTLALVAVDGPLQPFGPRAQMEGFFGPLFNDYKNQSAKFIDGLLGPVRQDVKTAIRPVMLAAPDYVAVSAMKAMLDDSIWTNDQIKVPVLAIMAKNPMYPSNIEDGFRKVAPNLEFQMWEGVSHFLMMEEPVKFIDTVNFFISKNKLLYRPVVDTRM